MVQAAKLLAGNKFYMMICVTYILQQIYGAMISMGTYYATYILGNQCTRNRCQSIAHYIQLIHSIPLCNQGRGEHQCDDQRNVDCPREYTEQILVAVAGYMGSGNVTLMLLFTAIAALGQGPWRVRNR